MLEDAIRVEELGVTTPADECAEQATCLPSIPRDQISMLQQKDAAIVRLKHYLDLGRKPNRQERKRETRETLQLVGYLDSIAEKDGLLFRTVRNNNDQLKQLLVVPRSYAVRSFRQLIMTFDTKGQRELSKLCSDNGGGQACTQM